MNSFWQKETFQNFQDKSCREDSSRKSSLILMLYQKVLKSFHLWVKGQIEAH